MRMDAQFRLYGARMHLRADPQIARYYTELLENTHPQPA